MCSSNLGCQELTRCVVFHSLPCNMPGKPRPKALSSSFTLHGRVMEILSTPILCDKCWENRLKIYRTIEALDMTQFEEIRV